jgi:hypothetical protein
VCVWVLLFHLESWKIARAEIRAVERAQGTKREKERAIAAAISALAHSRLNANGSKLRISTHGREGLSRV